jgi:HEPN domain-containing protein
VSPKSQERRFERKYARTLLRIAERDLSSGHYASRGIDSGEVRPENVLFLYQQSAEKLLKAVLCHLEIPIPLVHDLGVLLAKLPRNTQPEVGYEINSLNDYAGVWRYEEASLVYEPEDLEEAYQLCNDLMAWARAIIEA